MDHIINVYQQHGHMVKHFTSDDEANLKATLPHLLIRKITHSSTPAGLHEKKSERSIQTLKYRLSAIKAGLTYILPSRLECEAIMAVVDQLNSLPTTNTGSFTPLQAFTGRKPQVPAFAFGTIGVVYHPRQDDKTMRGEIGIFLSHGYHRRYIKGFIPTRDKTYSVRQLTPLREQVTPLSWKFQQNIRVVTANPPHNTSTDSTSELLESETLDVTSTQAPAKNTSSVPTNYNPSQDRDQPQHNGADKFGPPHLSITSRVNPTTPAEK
jgi:hypothetical protein